MPGTADMPLAHVRPLLDHVAELVARDMREAAYRGPRSEGVRESVQVRDSSTPALNQAVDPNYQHSTGGGDAHSCAGVAEGSA